MLLSDRCSAEFTFPLLTILSLDQKMSSKLIFVGPDDCLRIPVLIKAGYQVEHATSMELLSRRLQEAYDAILLSDRPWETVRDLMPPGSRNPSAPVIVFQETTLNLPERQFDLVVRNLEPPNEWLGKIAELLEGSNPRNSMGEV